MKKPLVISIFSIVILLGLMLIWYLVSPLFINETVNEVFPFDLTNQSEVTQIYPSGADTIPESALEEIEPDINETISSDDESKDVEQVLTDATLIPDLDIEENVPNTDTEIVAVSIITGTFQGIDNFHQSNGIANVFQLGDQLVLRFEEFMVTNGPDLHVYLVQNIDGTNQSSIGNYLDLGSLKGNLGNQNYELPVGTDLSQYQGVMIYCEPFHVVFAKAKFGS